MTNATLPQPEYMSIAEVAARLSLSKMTVYRLVQRGELVSIRAGRAYRILRTSYDAFTTPKPQAAPVIPGQAEICTRPDHACAVPGAGPCNGLPKTI